MTVGPSRGRSLRRAAQSVAVAMLVGAASPGPAPLVWGAWPVSPQSGGSGLAEAGTLAAPAQLTAACTSNLLGNIVVSWDPVAHATGYDVYSYPGMTLGGQTSSTTWSPTSISLLTPYQFEVAATVGAWQGSAAGPTATITVSGVLGVGVTCT